MAGSMTYHLFYNPAWGILLVDVNPCTAKTPVSPV